MLQGIIDGLIRGQRIALICHVSPDGDALGSAVALQYALEGMGKQVAIYCDGGVPANCRIIPGVDEVLRPPTAECYDTAVAIDVSELHRMGEAEALFKAAQYTLNIDHHGTNPLFAQVNLVEKRAATGEIILDLLKAMQVPLDRNIATALYVAISTDTGGLCYANTTPDTFRRVAELVEAGVEIAPINDFLYKRRSLKQTRILAKGLNNLVVDGKVAYIPMPYEDLIALEAGDGDCDGLVNYAREIEGIEMAFMAKGVEEHKVKVSLRGNGEADVCAVAACFGGGGHKQAAGCVIESDMDEAVARLLQAIREING